MRKPIQIGRLFFNTKKDALSYYKEILNSYDFGGILNTDDYSDVYNLLTTHKNATKKIGVGLKEIRVDDITYKTKCFQVIRTDMSSDFFSYIKCINGKTPPFTKFSKACREEVKEDIREVKLSYFKKLSSKGRVKCQETGDLCLWEELTVDHRQPNTFSIIVDRFIEVHNIDIEKVEYIDNDTYGSRFKDKSLIIEFQKYHKNKANLRIVKRLKNQGRAYQGRVTRQKKRFDNRIINNIATNTSLILNNNGDLSLTNKTAIFKLFKPKENILTTKFANQNPSNNIILSLHTIRNISLPLIYVFRFLFDAS